MSYPEPHPVAQSATIAFRVGDQLSNFHWDDDDAPPNPNLSRVSVFDRHCASVYVSQRTDVAFRPLGLDLFDKLSAACEAVKKTLERERNSLESQGYPNLNVAPGTAVHDLIGNLTSLTNPDSVRTLASLSVAETDRHRDIQKRLRDLESDDPGKIARTLELRSNRIATLLARVRAAIDGLSTSSIDQLFGARDQSENARQVVETLRRQSLEQQPLPNTGSAAWRSLWHAARRFSTVEAYPDHPFPYTDEDSLCVFCQQKLSNQASRRLVQFNEFVESTAQSELDAALARYRAVSDNIQGLTLLDEAVNEALDELQIDARDVAATARAFFDRAEAQRNGVFAALADGLPRPRDEMQLSFDTTALVTQIEGLRDRAVAHPSRGGRRIRRTPDGIRESLGPVKGVRQEPAARGSEAPAGGPGGRPSGAVQGAPRGWMRTSGACTVRRSHKNARPRATIPGATTT